MSGILELQIVGPFHMDTIRLCFRAVVDMGSMMDVIQGKTAMLGHHGKIRTLEVDAIESSYFLPKILFGYI